MVSEVGGFCPSTAVLWFGTQEPKKAEPKEAKKAEPKKEAKKAYRGVCLGQKDLVGL